MHFIPIINLTYQYFVRAENIIGQGPGITSNSVKALYTEVPENITSISAEAYPGKIIVTWTSAERADHYRLARQISGGSYVLQDGNIPGTSYEDTTAVAGNQYRYLVNAENNIGKSGNTVSGYVTAIGA